MRSAGYDLGDGFPGLAAQDGDALMHALIAAGGQDPDWLTEEQLSGNPIRIAAEVYGSWYATLPAQLRQRIEEHWGPPPGQLYVDTTGEIVLAGLRAGNVVVMVQPPRGFGANPIAIYHDPDLPPTTTTSPRIVGWPRNSARMRWCMLASTEISSGCPEKTVGMSASCGPDAALGNLPLIYPFLVNDPGEGTQAKRRAHATLVDHLVPPMARAESYGDLARLEQLLDEHANIAAMDPAKLPAIRAQIWTLIQAAKLDHDLGLDDRPHDAEFDDFLLHVDGWLCEVKDAQIRDGLHVLGAAPSGPGRVNLVLAMLRAQQIWGGRQTLPGLREALGLAEDGSAARVSVDEHENTARALVEAMEDRAWDATAAMETVHAVLGRPDKTVAEILTFAATEIVPRLARTTDEIDAVLHALEGGYVPAGPSGSPLRGLVNVLPTGRNFYSVDPKAVPSRLAWETGQALADSLVARYRADTGEWPRSVGLSCVGHQRDAYVRRRHRRGFRSVGRQAGLGRCFPASHRVGPPRPG